jgi:hypothetical protein
MKPGSRHIACASAVEKQSFLSRSGRHSESACYFLNGILFNGKPLNEFCRKTSAGVIEINIRKFGWFSTWKIQPPGTHDPGLH